MTRKKYWKLFVSAPKRLDSIDNARLNAAVKSWYKEHDSEVFKGKKGFTFIKNEVFGSNDKLFNSLVSATMDYLA